MWSTAVLLARAIRNQDPRLAARAGPTSDSDSGSYAVASIGYPIHPGMPLGLPGCPARTATGDPRAPAGPAGFRDICRKGRLDAGRGPPGQAMWMGGLTDILKPPPQPGRSVSSTEFLSRWRAWDVAKGSASKTRTRRSLGPRLGCVLPSENRARRPKPLATDASVIDPEQVEDAGSP
jgi:hypothetical protein